MPRSRNCASAYAAEANTNVAVIRATRRDGSRRAERIRRVYRECIANGAAGSILISGHCVRSGPRDLSPAAIRGQSPARDGNPAAAMRARPLPQATRGFNGDAWQAPCRRKEWGYKALLCPRELPSYPSPGVLMRHRFVGPDRRSGVGLALLSTAPSAARQDLTPTNVTSISAAEFFTLTKVWTAHLSMSADAWRAMQPQNGASGGGFGFGGSRFLGPPGGRNGVAARQGIEFDYVHATLQIDDWTFRDVAVRYKGNGSYLRASRAGSDKISLKVDLNKYVKGQELAGLTTINFQNNITDVGWMNEVLAYRLYRDAGALAPRTTYAQVYLTVEGQARSVTSASTRSRRTWTRTSPRIGSARRRAPSSSHPPRICSPTGARTGRSTTSRTIPRPT